MRVYSKCLERMPWPNLGFDGSILAIWLRTDSVETGMEIRVEEVDQASGTGGLTHFGNMGVVENSFI